MLRTLTDTQTAAFDSSTWDRKSLERWMRVDEVETCLSPYLADHPEGLLLDLGGGTGRFADVLLARHAACRVAIGDNSDLLLSRNEPNPRKTVLCVDAAHLADSFAAQSVDVVFVHRLLHHLVGDSYSESIRSIRNTLRQCGTILKPHGRVSIIENIWDGRFVDGLSNRLLYGATSSLAFSPIARRLGSNTAGIGVCYLSDRLLRMLLGQTGFCVEARLVLGDLTFPWYIRIPTLLKRAQSVHYWCGRA
jgi:SAM-dependent methyltransferase